MLQAGRERIEDSCATETEWTCHVSAREVSQPSRQQSQPGHHEQRAHHRTKLRVRQAPIDRETRHAGKQPVQVCFVRGQDPKRGQPFLDRVARARLLPCKAHRKRVQRTAEVAGFRRVQDRYERRDHLIELKRRCGPALRDLLTGSQHATVRMLRVDQKHELLAHIIEYSNFVADPQTVLRTRQPLQPLDPALAHLFG